MKITPAGPGAIDAYRKQTGKNKVASQNQTVPEHDRAEISNRGRQIQTYRTMLKEMPATRADRVADLKNRINNGTYEPSAEKIAEGIIAEGIMRERHLETIAKE